MSTIDFSYKEAERLIPVRQTPRLCPDTESENYQWSMAWELARRAGCYDAQDALAWNDFHCHPPVGRHEQMKKEIVGAIPVSQPQRHDATKDQLVTVGEIMFRLGCVWMAERIEKMSR